MNKVIIECGLVVLIAFGCSSSAKQKYNQQLIQNHDSLIVIIHEYINQFKSLAEKIKSSEKDTLSIVESMNIEHQKWLSLLEENKNLRKMTGVSMPKRTAWAKYNFLNSKIHAMQLKFIADVSQNRKELKQELFYNFFVDSYSKYIDSLNVELKDRYNLIKELNLISDLDRI